MFQVVLAPKFAVELKLVVDVAAVVKFNPPVTVPPVKLKVLPPLTVMFPVPVNVPLDTVRAVRLLTVAPAIFRVPPLTLMVYTAGSVVPLANVVRPEEVMEASVA